MLWNICLVAAALCAIAAVWVALQKKLGRLRLLYVLLGCVLMAYILYIPPFFLQFDFVAALLGCFLNTLQVISLDADYLEFYDLILHALGGGVRFRLYFACLAAMHFLLPAVSAMTAVTVILRCLTQLRIAVQKRHRRPLYVFNQINYRSLLLARDIHRRSGKCDILFLNDPEAADYTDLQQELHCMILNESVDTVCPDSTRRRVDYYCISEDPEKNLSAALTVLGRLEKAGRKEQENNHIFLFTSDPNAELLIDSVQKGFVNVSLIDECRTDAYNLLERHPLFRYAREKRVHVLVCGFSPQGEAFLRAAVWCGQMAGYDLRFTVLERNAEDPFADFKARYPGLFSPRHHIECYSWHNEAQYRAILREHCADADYIVVACKTERETVARAVDLRRFFYRVDGQFRNAPPIFAYIERGEKAAAVAALTTAEARPERRMPYGITPYGMAEKLYTYQNITDSDLELLSKNVHLVYEDIFSDGELDVAGALERYNLFEVNKSSNRANALHIRCKLAMLGLDYTDGPEGEEVELEDCLTDELLEKLTVAEHDRWVAFLDSEGWEESTVEQAHAYKQAGISKGRHNCPLLKLHPYLCSFEQLPRRSERLGLPDSTVYDRELIRRIPDILHDRWNISHKKYRIIKAQHGNGLPFDRE